MQEGGEETAVVRGLGSYISLASFNTKLDPVLLQLSSQKCA
jgi:hypothetical protein